MALIKPRSKVQVLPPTLLRSRTSSKSFEVHGTQSLALVFTVPISEVALRSPRGQSRAASFVALAK